jgi:hypothetical protein
LNKRILKRQGARSPITTSLFYNTSVDTTIPYAWRVTKDRLYVHWKGLSYVDYDKIEFPEQTPELPLYDAS